MLLPTKAADSFAYLRVNLNNMTNIWRDGRDLETNPYHETAFKAAGVTRDASPEDIERSIQGRLKIIKRMGLGYLVLKNRSLDNTDIARARQILLGNPTRRILEELLEHQSEPLPVERLVALQTRLEQLISGEPPPGLDAQQFAYDCVRALALDVLEQMPVQDTPPFPIDTTPIPPFGLPEKTTDGY